MIEEEVLSRKSEERTTETLFASDFGLLTSDRLLTNTFTTVSTMIIDHICFAVKDLNDGIAYWEKVFGYKQMTRIIENSRQKVRVTFLKKEDSIAIKLIEPVESNLSLLNFVSKGGGFHHICFRCDNIYKQVSELREKGLVTLVPPQPGEAFNNHNIAFMFSKIGVNVELIDTDEKADVLN